MHFLSIFGAALFYLLLILPNKSQVPSPRVVMLLGAILEPRFALVLEFAEKGSLASLLKDPSFDVSWELYGELQPFNRPYRFQIDFINGRLKYVKEWLICIASPLQFCTET